MEDGLYLLPHNAYSNRNKEKDGSDKDKGDSVDKEKDATNCAPNTDAGDSHTDEGSGKKEQGVKGLELVEKEKWEVTPVPAQQGSSGIDKKKS